MGLNYDEYLSNQQYANDPAETETEETYPDVWRHTINGSIVAQGTRTECEYSYYHEDNAEDAGTHTLGYVPGSDYSIRQENANQLAYVTVLKNEV